MKNVFVSPINAFTNEALEGSPRYTFKYFEKYPLSVKRSGQISPIFTPIQKAFYHHIHKSTLHFHKSIPSLLVFCQYPYIPKMILGI